MKDSLSIRHPVIWSIHHVIAFFGLLLLFWCFSLDTYGARISVSGISGRAKNNVEKHLEELQQLKSLSQFSPEELKEQVLKSLQPFGYFKAEAQIQSKENQWTIKIKPGPQIKITRLNVELLGEGAKNPLLLQTLKKIPLKLGAPFITKKYNRTKQNLINAAENQGYMHANFKKNEIIIDEEQYTAEITLIFDTGSLYHFGQTQFDPTYIKPELLHRYVPFSPGEAYSGDKILKLNNDLTGSGYFKSVVVKPQIGDHPQVPVSVHVEPVPKRSYILGAGYGTDTGVRGRAALHVIPVNRSGHKFNAVAQGSFVQNALQAQYIMPGKNPIQDQYSLTGNYSNLNYSSGYSNAWLFSLAQQHRIPTYQRTFSLNSLYEGFHYNDQKNTKQLLFYPKASFSFIRSKDLLFSPSGYNITLNGLGASTALLSTTNFAQISIDAKAALRIDPWRLRLYGHAIQGFTAIDNVNKQPLSLALLLGGMDNLKSYGYNSVGPGRIISYAGVEIQKETKKNWYVLAFYDVGDVYDPTPAAFKHDVGAGLMWVSPIGPIKIGVAQGINSNWQRNSNGPRLVVNMGPDL